MAKSRSHPDSYELSKFSIVQDFSTPEKKWREYLKSMGKEHIYNLLPEYGCIYVTISGKKSDSERADFRLRKGVLMLDYPPADDPRVIYLVFIQLWIELTKGDFLLKKYLTNGKLFDFLDSDDPLIADPGTKAAPRKISIADNINFKEVEILQKIFNLSWHFNGNVIAFDIQTMKIPETFSNGHPPRMLGNSFIELSQLPLPSVMDEEANKTEKNNPNCCVM